MRLCRLCALPNQTIFQAACALSTCVNWCKLDLALSPTSAACNCVSCVQGVPCPCTLSYVCCVQLCPTCAMSVHCVLHVPCTCTVSYLCQCALSNCVRCVLCVPCPCTVSCVYHVHLCKLCPRCAVSMHCVLRVPCPTV